ncbi:MAG: protein kinase [Planctomycetales bacterium]|nr:protein kinase [Planctomycetales bacterium]
MKIICPQCSSPDGMSETIESTVHGSRTVRSCSLCGYQFAEPDDRSTRASSSEMDGSGDIAGLGEPEETTLHTKTGRRQIGHFSLLENLGKGAFGEVWLAEDHHLGRRVALKLPRPRRSNEALLHEARTAAKLTHPNIVSIYEVGIENQQVYIASEFIDGEDLQTELSRGRPAVSRATSLVATLALAVHHAHRNGVVHRDLKPANVIIDADGAPHVADFGIAKQLDADETISTDGAIVGTISYMSPEQAQGQTRLTDHRADVYSLGVMLFELLTEYCPFRGNSRAVLHQKIYEDAPSPRRLVPGLDRDLETICLKCLEREPGNRYQSAQQLADELERHRSGQPIHARPIGRMEKLWRWSRRNPVPACLVAAVVLSLALGLAGTSSFWLTARRHAKLARQALHRAKLNAAADQWARGDLRSLRKSLKPFGVGEELHDLRDFSSQYYERLAGAYAQVVQHADTVVNVAVSANGELFAAAGADRAVSVWSSSDGELVRTLPAQSGKIVGLAFLGAGRRLAVAHANGSIHLWIPGQHQQIIRTLSHGAGLNGICVSPDGRTLLSMGRGGKAVLWNLPAGPDAEIERQDLDTGESPAVGAAFSSNGSQLAIVNWNGVPQQGSVQVWDTDTIARTLEVSVASPQCVTFHGDHELAIGTYRGSLAIVSLPSGDVEMLLVAGTPIGDVASLGDDSLAVAALHPGLLILRDRQRVRQFWGPRFTFGMLDHSARSGLLVTSGGDNAVNLLHVKEALRADVYWRDTHVRRAAFLTERQLVLGDGNGALIQLDLDRMVAQDLDPGDGGELLSLVVDRDRGQLLAAGMRREVMRFDWTERKVLAKFPLPAAGVSALETSFDGAQLLIGNRNGSLMTASLDSTNKPVSISQRPDCSVHAVRRQPGAEQYAVAYSDGAIQIISQRAGDAPLVTLKTAAEPICLDYCLDGTRLLAGLSNGAIVVYDVATWRPIQTIDAHAGRVNCLRSFPDGGQFVTGGRDRVVSIWDAATGEKISDFGVTQGRCLMWRSRHRATAWRRSDSAATCGSGAATKLLLRRTRPRSNEWQRESAGKVTFQGEPSGQLTAARWRGSDSRWGSYIFRVPRRTRSGVRRLQAGFQQAVWPVACRPTARGHGRARERRPRPSACQRRVAHVPRARFRRSRSRRWLRDRGRGHSHGRSRRSRRRCSRACPAASRPRRQRRH